MFERALRIQPFAELDFVMTIVQVAVDLTEEIDLTVDRVTIEGRSKYLIQQPAFPIFDPV